MSVRTRSAAAVAVVAIIAALAGCSTPVTTGPTDPAEVDHTPSLTTPAPSDTGGVAGPDSIDGVQVGEPFSSETAGIPGFAAVEGCEWVGQASRDDYSLTVQRDAADDEDGPVVLVAVSAPADDVPVAGPVTAEGIGIGSTVDDARAAYPDAEETRGEGDRRYLRVDEAGESALFLSYTDGEQVIWALTATSLETPPYEPCA